MDFERTAFTADRPKQSYGTMRKTIGNINNLQNGYINYKVIHGDTLQGIALKHDITMAELKRINRIWTNDALFIDRVLKIPTKYNSKTSKHIPSDLIGSSPSTSFQSPNDMYEKSQVTFSAESQQNLYSSFGPELNRFTNNAEAISTSYYFQQPYNNNIVDNFNGYKTFPPNNNNDFCPSTEYKKYQTIDTSSISNASFTTNNTTSDLTDLIYDEMGKNSIVCITQNNPTSNSSDTNSANSEFYVSFDGPGNSSHMNADSNIDFSFESNQPTLKAISPVHPSYTHLNHLSPMVKVLTGTIRNGGNEQPHKYGSSNSLLGTFTNFLQTSRSGSKTSLNSNNVKQANFKAKTSKAPSEMIEL